ncbi:helix-turn-helix domain-containing protein [Leptolyngbyaceae cyanobacterium UHCC 1019]
MSLTLTAQTEAELWQEAEQCYPSVITIDRMETISPVPPTLGHGYRRTIQLMPGFELCLFHEAYEDVNVRVSPNPHPVQFQVLLAGIADCGDFLYIDAQHGYVGGSGIQPTHDVFNPAGHPKIGVDVHLEPKVVRQLFRDPSGEVCPEWLPLLQGDNPQQVFAPKTTLAMRSLVQQMWDCPFSGGIKQVYLQSKALELIALQLTALQEPSPSHSSDNLKPQTLSRVYQAAELLRSHLDHPLSQIELAQRVGVSDRTLRRGFQVVFGTTVCGYLLEQRLIQAEQLLCQTNWTVAEVAHRTGYSNQGHFAAAFKRKFGMTPKQCMMGR